jgi:hypothetical protein
MFDLLDRQTNHHQRRCERFLAAIRSKRYDLRWK